MAVKGQGPLEEAVKAALLKNGPRNRLDVGLNNSNRRARLFHLGAFWSIAN